MPSYWLFKSEPDVFSIDDLAAVESEHWDGVRNYQARNNLQAMKVGDLGFFYHSRLNPSGIVGICEVVKEAYPDHTAFDPKNKYYDPKSTPEKPRWFMVDIKFVDKFSRMIDLHEVKSDPKLAEMALVKSSRLSVQPVSAKEWKHICKLAGG
ncbi:MAG: EVE domain-containing protein [Vulcanimicrobiota bacterium]